MYKSIATILAREDLGQGMCHGAYKQKYHLPTPHHFCLFSNYASKKASSSAVTPIGGEVADYSMKGL